MYTKQIQAVLHLKDSSLTIEEKTSLSEKEKADIFLLWNTTYPASIAHENVAAFTQYLSTLFDKHHTLIKNQANCVIAWYVDFIRNEERNFVIILSPEYQSKGIGSHLIHKAKTTRNEIIGWVVTSSPLKLDGTPYQNTKVFYLKNGFQVHSDQKHRINKLEMVKISWTSSL